MEKFNLVSETVVPTPESSSSAISGFASILPAKIVTLLEKRGFTEPTSIQEQSIPLALSGSDVLAQSPTGSGKTLAFSLPIIVKLGSHKKSAAPRALILTPTRELGSQITEVFSSLLSSDGPKVLSILGGSSYTRQKSQLQSGSDIVVGTPGRVADLLRQEVLDLSKIEIFVLDEVDQMLDIGFAEELAFIRDFIKPESQTLFFSATLATRIRQLAKKMLKDPVEVQVKTRVANEETTIKHSYVELKPGMEMKALLNCLLFYKPKQALVFCETRQETADVAENLTYRGFNAAPLHGDLSQQERNKAMKKFKDGSLQYLITTNVAARGIDVSELPLVINYGVPWDPESYTHRCGRTGRAGKDGEAWTLVSTSNVRRFERILQEHKIQPNKIAIPSPADIFRNECASALLSEGDKTTNAGSETARREIEKFVSKIEEIEQLRELTQKLLFGQINRLGAYSLEGVVLDRPLSLFVRTKEKRSFREDSNENMGGRRRMPESYQRNRFPRGPEKSFGGVRSGKPAISAAPARKAEFAGSAEKPRRSRLPNSEFTIGR